ncbi:acyl-CoA dehydrogenase family protein [Nesterenkonia natronophila]|uniref:Acyl-CoA dehydrogenase n=1 Tax=Nesterenkonia natronophila TaxID=2174932 RepID=A0A3A4FBJ5_9MICC|nr:acyl-CoA dehydrogenase family protein [Nesterenkonia natronophila]RJN32487.1 acyl-CoA dehydrogenase [Nesterenkonia natronophila]
MTTPTEHWTREQLADIRTRVERFIDDIVIPQEPAPGQTLDLATRDQLRVAAQEAGIFAPHVPQRWGGLGLPISHWPEIFEAVGRSPIGPVVLNCMAPDEGNMHMLSEIATEEQKRKYLSPLASGETSSCFGMTEPHPGAGSDPSQLQTLARREAGQWVIHGEKRYSSGANHAGFMIVMAKTEPHDDPASAGATMFIVSMDAPGVSVPRQIDTIDRTIGGGHPHVVLDEVRVEEDDVLGEPHQGFRYAQVRLGPARLTHCMRWLGLATRAQEIALQRANEREIFDAKLSEQGIAQVMIADSEIDIETSRSIIARTARLLEDDPRAGSRLSSIAKVHCSEAVHRIIDRAVQLCGGDGVSMDLPLAQYLNEVRPFRIYDGSSETHRWAIARRAAHRQRQNAMHAVGTDQ